QPPSLSNPPLERFPRRPLRRSPRRPRAKSSAASREARRLPYDSDNRQRTTVLRTSEPDHLAPSEHAASRGSVSGTISVHPLAVPSRMRGRVCYPTWLWTRDGLVGLVLNVEFVPCAESSTSPSSPLASIRRRPPSSAGCASSCRFRPLLRTRG